jgi:hypothetical protein
MLCASLSLVKTNDDEGFHDAQGSENRRVYKSSDVQFQPVSLPLKCLARIYISIFTSRIH